ncbi:uncharacterized protein LOC128718713 [Anopheles marshallii]|uniref:uncharacterized protein LOC128718713 n=1 Tax=Anopheles marshallii TaxID=1521116 RepID=UPI00237AD0A0|nr:uncharacterized protein LOC128718713 [Anopheles marshallii]
MSNETMDAEEQGQDKTCRLCLKNITRTGNKVGIDISDSLDIRKLLLEVYEVKVLTTDSSPTMMCMPCYQQLVKHYSFRMKLFTSRKTFKLNQSLLVTHIIAFGDNSQQEADTKTDGDRFVSSKEQSTQTETPGSSEHSSPITTKSLDNGRRQNEKSASNVKQKPRDNAVTATNTISAEKRLVPLVVDCLKEPLYLKALHPILASTRPDNLAPLLFLCSRCYKTFNSKEKLEHHQSEGCVACCRFCQSEQQVDHSCPKQREYASFMRHIVGTQKYVSTHATTNAISENIADESVARVEREKSIEPKLKKRKLDANHNGRDSLSERNSTTPYSLHAEIPHIQAAEARPEPALPSVAASVVNVSSSDDDSSKLIIDEPKPPARDRSKSKKRRKY